MFTQHFYKKSDAKEFHYKRTGLDIIKTIDTQ